MTTMFPFAKPRQSAARSTHELRLTALHEARHAVACVALGVAVRSVTIVPNPAKRRLGELVYAPTSSENMATILAAGLLGERDQGGAERDALAKHSRRNQINGRANAVEIDIANERAVAKLADVLHRERTLSGEHLQSVLRDLDVRLCIAKRRQPVASKATPAEPDRRFTADRLSSVRVTQRANGQKRIVGLASVVYDGTPATEFELFPGLVERIMPGAFDDVLGDDVRALFNHDPNQVLGRTSAGTLTLNTDAVGLRYEIMPGKTSVAADVIEHVKRGDVSGSSFSFSMEGDGESVFREIGDDLTVREIVKFGRLFDVGPVTFPAYDATTTGLRSEHIAAARAAYNQWKRSR